MKSGLQSPKSKKVVTLAALSPYDIHQAGICKQKPQGRWMYDSHDRRSAAHGRKIKTGNSFVNSAEARGSTKPQG